MRALTEAVARLSSLVRLVDVRVPSNAFITVFALLVGFGSGYSHGVDSGVRGALVVFLVWAIGRELDPDRPLVACVAAVLAIPFAIFGDSDLLALACMLLAVRIVVRTAGKGVTFVDCIAIVALCAFAGRSMPTLVGAAVLVSSLVLDRAFPPATGRRVVLTACLAAVGAVFVAVFHASVEPGSWNDLATARWVAIALGVAASLVVAAFPLRTPLRSRGDATREPLLPVRLWLCRTLAASTVIVALAVRGGAAPGEFSALWAAIIAAAGCALWLRLQSAMRADSREATASTT